MYKITKMAELLRFIPRPLYRSMAESHDAEAHRKGFNSWNQLVAMVFAQLSGVRSLRTLCGGFNSGRAALYHLGCEPIARSTLSDANAKMDGKLFGDVAGFLLRQLDANTREELQELIFAIDSSSITLTGRHFDRWTQATRSRACAGVKLHVTLETAHAAPRGFEITDANVNDIEWARTQPIEPGVFYSFDKGYCDYGWWAKIDAEGARFVTRLKSNAGVRVERTAAIDQADAEHILADEIITFKHTHSRGGKTTGYQKPLRRITVARPEHPEQKPLVLVTNDLESPATKIAHGYRERWQVELFFKWIKQHLEVKRFLGHSKKAVRIQLICAIIAYALLSLQKKASSYAGTLWMFLSELRHTLFDTPTAHEAYLHRQQERRRREQEIFERQARLSW